MLKKKSNKICKQHLLRRGTYSRHFVKWFSCYTIAKGYFYKNKINKNIT